ncbi:helix-hairpin-helix domain-containing protein [Paenibacillus humicola]|uniref:helix-hairpin-helix domain-containing protein n=1 Tax=Paenibacillus humicola TaxID=3110540 RepID=UPI00237C2018|nr:helix-hairpin-helix domain-containing protein [Paenibacillus humicola]
MQMFNKRLGRRDKPALISLVILAIGAVMLATALLLQRNAYEPPGWQPVNGQVAEALERLDDAGKAASGALEVQETETAAQTDAVKAGRKADAGENAGMGGNADADGNAGTGGKADAGGNAGPGVGSGAGSAAGTQDGAVSVGLHESGRSDQASRVGGPSGSSAAVGEPAAGSDGEKSPAAGNEGRIDINRAAEPELDALPGIGESKAKAIVDERDRNGPFRSADDLLRVKGIGPKLLDKIKPFIVAGP